MIMTSLSWYVICNQLQHCVWYLNYSNLGTALRILFGGQSVVKYLWDNSRLYGRDIPGLLLPHNANGWHWTNFLCLFNPLDLCKNYLISYDTWSTYIKVMMEFNGYCSFLLCVIILNIKVIVVYAGKLIPRNSYGW